jgi:hypothetical protein
MVLDVFDIHVSRISLRTALSITHLSTRISQLVQASLTRRAVPFRPVRIQKTQHTLSTASDEIVRLYPFKQCTSHISR